ncbi:MAG: hypothetical protein ACWA5A_14165 [Marinibacterium sp.]
MKLVTMRRGIIATMCSFGVGLASAGAGSRVVAEPEMGIPGTQRVLKQSTPRVIAKGDIGRHEITWITYSEIYEQRTCKPQYRVGWHCGAVALTADVLRSNKYYNVTQAKRTVEKITIGRAGDAPFALSPNHAKRVIVRFCSQLGKASTYERRGNYLAASRAVVHKFDARCE